jgi:adenine-specific DNA-methyltransferase
MDQAQLTALTELLLSLVPADVSPVGNQALSQQFLAAATAAGYKLPGELYDILRDALVKKARLEKGKGRGGSVRRAAEQHTLRLDVQAVPAPAKPSPARSAGKAKTRPADPSDTTQVLSYRHLDTRKNNPEVGVVTPATDPATPPTTWSYDPHLDPELRFDINRATIEKLIDDALASGNDAIMRAALEELKRLQSPYLNWTGKTERTSFEVDTVSLHVHERIDPMSILSAVRKQMKEGRAGKVKPMVQAGLFEAPFESLPLRDAIDFYRHERGWANRLIAGDSLLVMNSLLQKESMVGQVQMIYIDPPYGIKYGSNFQPFVGKRDVKDRKDEDLTQEPEMIKAFRDTWELGIHSYLTYLRDRLLLAKELLSESGSVFVQISDENVHLVRNLLGEIFGEDNFVAQIAYKTSVGLGSSFLDRVNDYVVWFGKDTKKLKYRQLYLPLELGAEGATRYSYAQLPEGKVLPVGEIAEENISGIRFFTDQGLTSRTGSEGTSV